MMVELTCANVAAVITWCKTALPAVRYGVATVSRIDEITGLFCRISSLLWVSFAKETYDFIDPTNRMNLQHVVQKFVTSQLGLYFILWVGFG